MASFPQEYDKLRRENVSLRYKVNKLTATLADADKGLYTPAEKASHLKKINQLSHNLNTALDSRDRYKKYWEDVREKNRLASIVVKDLKKENSSLAERNLALDEENKSLKERIAYLEENGSEESAAKIKALTDEVCRLTAILNNDGTNSGTPTSKTPINKNKVIPNLREKSGRKKGGQPGHEQHTLKPIPSDEKADVVPHVLDKCPYCAGELEDTGYDEKDELDYDVRIIKKRHHFHKYRCKECGKVLRAPVPNQLKEKCQYGSEIKAIILSLLDLGFVSVNRIRRLIKGFFHGELLPSEAFIIGMQKKVFNSLAGFINDVKHKLITEDILYWDDTVAFINKTRGCMRFYGTEKIALYTAHATKGREGIDEDGLLASLSADTYVMHDHVTMNYNDDFKFANIECNQHLQRDLQKLAEISGHEWPVLLKELISTTIHERKLKQESGESSFSAEYINEFQAKLDKLLEKGDKEYADDCCRYYEEDERRLLNRIKTYRENYFLWVTDFRLPTTNNLSERSLRFTKIHDKVSGQFGSVMYAKYFAAIRTYLETCARNNINEYTALQRLTGGNPFSLSEVLSYGGK